MFWKKKKLFFVSFFFKSKKFLLFFFFHFVFRFFFHFNHFENHQERERVREQANQEVSKKKMTTTETSEQKGTTTGASAEIAKVWKNAGKAVGLEIWRIEQFKVVPQPKSTYGTFYSGDSYIVLNTYREPGRSALQWDVHFWLGRETMQDESGTAAYKTVELDDYLGGGPVEHREVQGH